MHVTPYLPMYHTTCTPSHADSDPIRPFRSLFPWTPSKPLTATIRVTKSQQPSKPRKQQAAEAAEAHTYRYAGPHAHAYKTNNLHGCSSEWQWYVCIYICICVCVCNCLKRKAVNDEREGGREGEIESDQIRPDQHLEFTARPVVLRKEALLHQET